MQTVRVTHLFSSFRGLGGVECVLQHHYEHDHRFQLMSRFIIYFEEEIEPMERVEFLGITGRNTIRQIREKVKNAIQQGPPDVAVYQGMWGMPHFADLDQAARRIVVLHGETPRMRRELISRKGWIDGLLCIGEPVRQTVCACAPELAAERAVVLPVPISPLGLPAPTTAGTGRPLILGFCSRLVVEQKRVDRLPQLCRHLDQHGIDYHLEFLGDGPYRKWLEEQFPDRTKFIFHGRKSGEEFWGILKGWDAILSMSDYEGTPIALLEALSMGVIPIYPRINSGADVMVQGLHPSFLYEPENFDQVAAALHEVRNLAFADLDSLRRRCREAVAGHMGDSYLREFSSFTRKILALPRVGRARFPKRPWPLNDLSMKALERFGAIRRSLLSPRQR